ncbi:MAG: Asp-tRNA(Asn)/Glu-tRNA(Gln) amidotransferase subunit GatA [Bacteroidota bacterium]
MKEYDKLADIQRDLWARSLSCSDLVDFYLARIEDHKDLNIFLEVYTEEARQKALEVDQKIEKGTAGRLAGLVLGIKDVICYKGHRLGASSQILGEFQSLFTATALQKLLDEDAIVIGHQNCDEFAMGSSNENSAFGPVRNPHDPNRVTGGSSGGSAAAVAANLCHASLGSDTGGSVRQPAGFCGVVGAKPTYGRISRYGLIAYASSFDQIGPITRSIEDAALLTEIMAGLDPHDQTSSSEKIGTYVDHTPQKDTYKIGYFEEVIQHPSLDAEIREQIEAWMERRRKEGHELVKLSFPLMSHMVPTYYVLTTAEASSNLSRYDGVRYGYRAPKAENLEELYVRSRSEAFGTEVKRRIMLGSFVLSAGYYDAYYGRAQKVRRKIQDQTHKFFAEVDFIMSPVSPGVAFNLGEKVDDPIEMYLSDIFTVHANLAGLPALAFPLGKHSSGMPTGIQLMANAFEEGELFSFSLTCKD